MRARLLPQASGVHSSSLTEHASANDSHSDDSWNTDAVWFGEQNAADDTDFYGPFERECDHRGGEQGLRTTENADNHAVVEAAAVVRIETAIGQKHQ